MERTIQDDPAAMSAATAALLQWKTGVDRAFEHSSPGSLAWLFSPGKVAQLPQRELSSPNSESSLVEHGRKKLLNSQVLATLGSRPHSIAGILPKQTQGSYRWQTYGVLKGYISPTFVELLLMAQKMNWPSVVELSLDIFDCWIEAVKGGELPMWTVSALSSISEFMVEAADAADEGVAALKADMIDDAADDFGGESGTTSNEFLQKVLNGVRKHIGKFRGDDANQGAYMILLSESIRVCLKLKNVQMATAFLKTIPTNQPISPTAPKGPATRFRYFYGNLLLQREQFTQAEEPLVWSFTVCPVKQRALKKSILACLVAVRLRLGQLPPVHLLESYQLTHYCGILEAVTKGDLRQFDRAKKANSELFYTEGTTLCLDRVKFVVQRVLCERIFHWACKNYFEPGKPTNVLPLAMFTAAFKWQTDEVVANEKHRILVDFDDEEMMCILSNLIKMNFIKGYIAWQQRKLVLSKKAPFPPIRD